MCGTARKAPELETVEYKLTNPPVDNIRGYVFSVILNYRSADRRKDNDSQDGDDQGKVPAIRGQFFHKDPDGKVHEVSFVAGEGDFKEHEDCIPSTSKRPMTVFTGKSYSIPSPPHRPPPPPPPRPPPTPPSTLRRNDSNHQSKLLEKTATVPVVKHSPPTEMSISAAVIGSLVGGYSGG